MLAPRCSKTSAAPPNAPRRPKQTPLASPPPPPHRRPGPPAARCGRPPLPFPPGDIDERHGLRLAAPHRQPAPQIQAGVDALVGVDGGKIACAEPPQHAVHAAARLRGNRPKTFRIDDETPAR